MKLKLALKLSALFGIMWLSVQQVKSSNVVGTNHTLFSETLEEERQVQVYLPPSYEETDQAYPVLYVLDGQRFYLYAISLYQSLTVVYESVITLNLWNYYTLQEPPPLWLS